jgi:hypothetical protein
MNPRQQSHHPEVSGCVWRVRADSLALGVIRLCMQHQNHQVPMTIGPEMCVCMQHQVIPGSYLEEGGGGPEALLECAGGQHGVEERHVEVVVQLTEHLANPPRQSLDPFRQED